MKYKKGKNNVFVTYEKHLLNFYVYSFVLLIFVGIRVVSLYLGHL